MNFSFTTKTLRLLALFLMWSCVSSVSQAGIGFAVTSDVTVTTPIATLSTLSSLSISSGSLNPAFESNTTSYTVSVANAISSITVIPTTTNAFANVRVNGALVISGTASQSIPLNVGSNTITIVSTAEDGTTTSTYSVVVTRAPSAIATLSALTLSTGTLSPSFSSNTLSYTASVLNATSTITVRPTTTNSFASVRVNGTLVVSGSSSQSIPITVGNNTITIVSTAQDGTTTSTYTVVVTRAEPSTIATLSALTLSTGTLSPSFSSNTLSYTASVLNATSTITVRPTTTNSFASVRVNGTLVTSGNSSQSIPLTVGSNTITIVSTAQDGATTSTYTVVVTRAEPSTIATLSALTLSTGTLSPSFSSNTLSYTASVLNATSTMTVMPTTTNSFATVRVNGTLVTSGNSSQSIPLTVGSNTITIVSTAQDGATTSTYTVVVTRAEPSTIATLSALTLSTGTLSPSFSSNTLSYTASVLNATSTMTLIPTTTNSFATVRVNGTLVSSGNSSQSIPLTVGSNTITIVSTAQDGTTTSTYTVVVTRSPSSVSTLASLSLSSGTLSPTFTSNTLNYTAGVLNATSTMTVVPTTTNSFATVRVNGTLVTSGSSSQSIPLTVGNNTITIVSTAQDGTTTSTYTVVVTRSPSSVSTLASLSLSSGTLSPTFTSSTVNYTVSVPHATSSITVTPTSTNAFATVRVNGTLVTSGSASQSIPLNVGDNTITIVGTAQDGTTVSTYTIVIHRSQSSISTLASLTLSSGILNPVFASNILNYTTTVSNATSSITVTPAGSNAFATLRVNGTLVTSGTASQSIPLNVGSNSISIIGTSQDGTTTTTYTVMVTRISNVATLSSLTLSGGALSPVFSSNTTNYTASVTNATSSITVTPTTTSAFATAHVNGTLVTSGTASQSIPLNFGSNMITVVGTAQDGTTVSTYTVVVTRPISTISTLSSLSLSSDSLSPTFASNTLNYTATVSNATSSITVTPTTTNAFATVRVNGAVLASGTASQSIPLNEGNNPITIVSTAQDGTTTSSYNVTINRRSSVSTVSSLTISRGELIANSASGTSYIVSLDQSVTSVTVRPTASHPQATIKVNGSTVASGTSSNPIILGLEASLITIEVTAEDPAFSTIYRIVVGERVLLSNQPLVTVDNDYLASGVSATIALGFVPPTGADLTLVNHRGIGFIRGQFSNLPHGKELIMSVDGKEYRYIVDYFGGTGNDLVLRWANNAIVAWGENGEGQLGIGSLANQSVPTDLVASGILSGKKVKAVAAGAFHTLALSDEGVLTSWGLNSSGQLGTNNTANSRLPVAVSRPAFLEGKQIVAIAAGENFSMALCSDGTLATWGDNTYGQLGDGSAKVNSIEPVNITGRGALFGRTVSAICAGSRHAMALCTDGRVVSWGLNENGQLGNGANQNSNLPVMVTSLTGLWSGKTVRSISAGGKHSMVLFTDGAIASWGANQAGQLGNNSTTPSNVPILIPVQGAISGKTVIGVAAGGDHSLALCSDGTVAGWGLNLAGQLGNSSNNTSFVPIPVTMNTGALLNKRVIAIAASLDHSVALCSDETMVSWGANVFGSLGNNSNTSSNIPVAVTRSGVLSSKKVASVACAGAQSFALCSDGTLTSWGLNTFGQLGNNTTESSRVPVAVTTTTGALFGKTILTTTVGKAHTVVRFSNGAMAAWGRNAEGQLGNNATTNSNIPVEVFHSGVLLGKIIVDVSAGANHNIALCSDGTVVTWGSNLHGQLGIGTAIVSSVIPVNVTGLGALAGKTVVAVKAGANHCLALCSDGKVVAWGRGNFGQLGSGLANSSNLPVAVSWTGVMVGKIVTSIAAGADHNLAICSDGTLVAWGRNDFGQIGNNLIGNPLSPARVETTSGALMGKTVSQIAAGSDHSLALMTDGTVAAWGSNAQGQLGSIGSNGSFVPIAVTRNIGALFGKTVTSISSGEYHSMALSSDGSLAAWGQGTAGQLGNNTLVSSDIPESVTTSGALSDKRVWSLASGGGSSFALAALPARTLAASLYDLSVEGSNLSTVFDPDIDAYQTSVSNSVTTAKINAVALNPTSKIKINGVLEGVDSVTKSVPLNVGNNIITIEVIAEDDSSTAVYTLTITRASSVTSNVSTLAGLSMSSGVLSPSFSSNTLNYSASVSNATSSVTVTPSATNASATVRVNGNLVASGSASPSIPLSVGSNTITVVGTSQDGTSTSTYQIVVTRASVSLSNISTLSGLSISTGSLSPVFSSNTLNYSCTVTNATSSIKITPTVTQASATVQVNGSVVTSGSASQNIPLSIGQNTITVIATAQDGVTQSTYTINVTRASDDFDGDGLTDTQELLLGTSIFLIDSDFDGITDANEDADNDGIANGYEFLMTMNPMSSDSDGNGLSDTMEFIFDMGDLPVFSPRVGDRVRLNVRALGHGGAMRLSGRLPTGLTFNAITGIIEGKLAAAAKTSTVLIQYLNGTTVTRSIPLTIPVLPFPAALTGTWQALIYNEQGIPQGMLTTTLSSPGTWTASLDLAGATALRSARGTFDLKPAEENVNLSLRFAATTTLPQLDLALDIFGSSSLCEGDSSFGKIKGFRLAKAGEFPAVTTTMTILFDHGDHDGFAIPAGYGFATGSITPTGTIALTGQLGDSQPLRTSMRLGATGQAILWIKPYKNRASKLGGVISLHDTGVIPLTNASLNESELWWHRVPDATELSYPAGFAPISVRPRVQRHIVPLNATGLSQILGLANQAYTDVDFSGAGLAMLENNLSFPSLLTMDSAYKLLPQYPLGKPPIAWAGTIAPRTGSFTGTLTLATAIGDIRVGRITAAGIVFPLDEESGAVGAGVIKIPTTTRTGAFRTGRFVLRP